MSFITAGERDVDLLTTREGVSADFDGGCYSCFVSSCMRLKVLWGRGDVQERWEALHSAITAPFVGGLGG